MTMNAACYLSACHGKSLHEQYYQSYQISSPAGIEETLNPPSESHLTTTWHTPSTARRDLSQPSPHRTTMSGHTDCFLMPEMTLSSGPPIRYIQNSRSRLTESTQLREAHSSRHGPSQATRMEIRCWDHGCEGRKFSSLGNYRRHLREKNGHAKVFPCPDCGKAFTRSTARNYHKESGTCGQGPRQLMLQMQTGLQLQAETPHYLESPPINAGPTLPFASYMDSNSLTGLCSTPEDFIWGNDAGMVDHYD